MDVKELKERVLKANLMLPKHRLVTFTWDNVNEYDQETGRVVVECCKDYKYIPAVLVANHGPFVWGSDCFEAVHKSVVLEKLSAMAWITKTLRLDTEEMPKKLLDKHFFRKHGANAYYGQ